MLWGKWKQYGQKRAKICKDAQNDMQVWKYERKYLTLQANTRNYVYCTLGDDTLGDCTSHFSISIPLVYYTL